jgi:2-C-methyl-D-erythritol 2,4-cyclodiphosphate synthase
VAIQEPKILPHREAIRKSISEILQVDVDQVFIKAKTGEKLGPVGNSEAVEVWATCLLTK